MNSLFVIFITLVYCIVCGNSEEEVKRLFCFPRQPEKSKRWLQAMGIKIQTLSGHVRICDQHFGEECFIPYMSDLRLKHDALPTIINRKVPAICSDQETSEPLPNKSFCLGESKPRFCSPSTSALCTSDMHLQPKALSTKLKSPEIPALGAQQQT